MDTATYKTYLYEDNYWISFYNDIFSINKEEIIKFPFLKTMVESSMKNNLRDGIYYVNIDLEYFKLVYNYVIFNIKPKKDVYDIFTQIYEYIFLGNLPELDIVDESSEKSEKKITMSDEMIELYSCYLSDDKYSFKKLAFKIFMKDDITFSLGETETIQNHLIKKYKYKTLINMITKKFGAFSFVYRSTNNEYKSLNNTKFIFYEYIRLVKKTIEKQNYRETKYINDYNDYN
jgi:hypothetical protein